MTNPIPAIVPIAIPLILATIIIIAKKIINSNQSILLRIEIMFIPRLKIKKI